jgi:hypothetical protein
MTEAVERGFGVPVGPGLANGAAPLQAPRTIALSSAGTSFRTGTVSRC